MRRILVLFLITALLLAGCATSDPDGTVMTIGQTYSDFEGVDIGVVNVLKGELEVQWSNDTGYDVIYGEAYFIDREENGEWVSCALGDEIVFTAIGYVLEGNTDQTKIYHLANTYDISQPGKYRFRTDCHIEMGAENKQCNLWAEFTVDEEPETVEGRKENVVFGYDVQYIRTNGYQDGAKFPAVRIIRSVEELNDYYENNKDTFDLERGFGDSVGFLAACDKYDEAYFESKYLVFVLLEEGSGSIRHEVTGVQMNTADQLAVDITAIVPEAGTCDMAEWHIIIELDRNVEMSRESDVLLNITTEEPEELYVSWADSPLDQRSGIRCRMEECL